MNEVKLDTAKDIVTTSAQVIEHVNQGQRESLQFRYGYDEGMAYATEVHNAGVEFNPALHIVRHYTRQTSMGQVEAQPGAENFVLGFLIGAIERNEGVEV